jgi:hypothetical protein
MQSFKFYAFNVGFAFINPVGSHPMVQGNNNSGMMRYKKLLILKLLVINFCVFISIQYIYCITIIFSGIIQPIRKWDSHQRYHITYM